MEKITPDGLDLAKPVFRIHSAEEDGRPVPR